MNNDYFQNNLRKIAYKNYEGGKIFWRGNAIGATMLIFLAGFLIFGVVGGLMFHLLGGSTSGDMWMFQFLFMMIVMTLPFLLGPLLMREKAIDLLPFNKVPVLFFVLLIIMQLGVGYTGSFFSLFLNFLFENITGAEPSAPGFANIPSGMFGQMLYVVSISFAPALAEELAFRGIILGGMRKYGNMNAVIISSLLFALMHGNMRQIPFTFVFGIAMGIATVLSNSIWPAVVAHFLNNFFAAMLGVAGQHGYETLVTASYLVFMFIMIFAGVGILIYLMIKYWQWFKHQGSLCYNHWGKRFTLLMVNPCMVVAMIVLLAQVVLNFLF